MGEKGNVADVAGVAGDASHNVITDTASSGLNLATGIATGAVTGAAAGIVKDGIDEKLDKG